MDNFIGRIFAFGDIAHQGHNHPAVARVLCVEPQFDPSPFAVPAVPLQFHRLCLNAADDDAVIDTFKLFARRCQHAHRPRSQQLLAARVLHPAGRVVDMDEAHAGAIDQINRIRRRVHGRAEPLQGRLAALALGNIQMHHHRAIGMAARQGHHGHQKPALFAG